MGAWCDVEHIDKSMWHAHCFLHQMNSRRLRSRGTLKFTLFEPNLGFTLRPLFIERPGPLRPGLLLFLGFAL